MLYEFTHLRSLEKSKIIHRKWIGTNHGLAGREQWGVHVQWAWSFSSMRQMSSEDWLYSNVNKQHYGTVRLKMVMMAKKKKKESNGKLFVEKTRLTKQK